MALSPTFSLHLTDNLTRLAETFDHLHTFLTPPNGVVALLEQIVNFIGPIHMFEELPLHLVFGVPIDGQLKSSSGTMVKDLTRRGSA